MADEIFAPGVRRTEGCPAGAYSFEGAYEALRAAGIVPEHIPRPLERPGKGRYLRWTGTDGAQWSLTHHGRTTCCVRRSPTRAEREEAQRQFRARTLNADDLPPYLTPRLAEVIRMRRDRAFQAFMARVIGC